MKDLLLYVFYRASKFYKFFGERYYYISGKYVLLLTLSLNVLSLIQIVCRILKIVFKSEVIITVILSSVLFGYFIPWEKKYKELEEKYKNEDKIKWKGWLIVLYIVLSLIFYIVVLGISVRFEKGGL
jgi:Mn2+/Fe2+ NRAMP family transporter